MTEVPCEFLTVIIFIRLFITILFLSQILSLPLVQQ